VGGSESGQFWLGARSDYAIRALAELAVAPKPLTAEQIARSRDIPKTFLTVILSQLVRGGLVRSRRGRIGGYQLDRPPDQISMADVLTAVGHSRVAPPLGVTDPYQRLRGRLGDVVESLTLAELLATNFTEGRFVLADEEPAGRRRSSRSARAR
jgi:Rrf2 family protein